MYCMCHVAQFLQLVHKMNVFGINRNSQSALLY